MTSQTKRSAPTKAVLSNKGNSNTRYLATRQINLHNKTVAGQVRHIEYFALNYSSAASGFIRSGQSESLRLYDQYVETLIQTAHQLVTNEIDNLKPIFDSYLEKGYVFDVTSKPTTVVVQIARNCVNEFIELLLKIDELVTLLNHLEKTPDLKTPALFNLVQEWSDVPRQINSRLQGLAKKLNTKFNFNPKEKNIKALDIDFSKVNDVLMQFQFDKAQLLAKQPPQSLSEANAQASARETQSIPMKMQAQMPKSNAGKNWLIN